MDPTTSMPGTAQAPQPTHPTLPASSFPPLTLRERRAIDEILAMYREGWFPMGEEADDEGAQDQPPGVVIRWVQPHRRGIIPLDHRFQISRSLRARVRSGFFTITTDLAFSDVIDACAQPAPGREETWLEPGIIEAFELLHKAGLAHSIEAWIPDPKLRGQNSPVPGHTLVGGLYGLSQGSVFCGESMFSRPALGGTDASKVCLVHLVHHLRRRGFSLLDAQLTNLHLTQFGCMEMPREEYLKHLETAADRKIAWAPFEPDITRGELFRPAKSAKD